MRYLTLPPLNAPSIQTESATYLHNLQNHALLRLQASQSCSSYSLHSKLTTLDTGLIRIEDFVFIFTVLTSPSLPSLTSMTKPKGHKHLGVFSSSNKTTSPILTFFCFVFHLFLLWSSGIYSLIHLFQNWLVKC